ncbi:MAG: HDOD domain-containing protein [Planctomycetes bacterium]|nr:HDOD domain-containing protein [Planctomycetota bacterium]
MKAKILDAIKNSAAVPSVPQVVTRFLEIMQNPEFNYDDLVRILAADAGTVGEILRLVNSALFGVRNKIVSLRQALTLLGPMRTRSLLLGRYLVDSISSKTVPGLDMKYFWRRSLTSSVVASHLAEKMRGERREVVFIAALLADVGIAILAEAFPCRYRHIAERYSPGREPFSADDELAAVDLTHGEVSAMVLSHWSLPETVTKSVNLHQSANPGNDEAATIARILNASDSIAQVLCDIPCPDNASEVCVNAVSSAGIDVDVLIKQLPHIENDIEELASVLRIDVISSNIYAQIATAIQDSLAST